MSSLSPNLPASATHQEGVALFRAAKYEEARAAFEVAALQARAAQDKRASAEVANDLGVTYQKLGQRAAARVQLESALAQFTELNDDGKRAQALGNLGTLLAAI